MKSGIPEKIYCGLPRELSYEKLLTWSVTGEPYRRFNSRLGFELGLREMIKSRGQVGIKGAAKGKGGVAGELGCEKLLVWAMTGAPCPGFGQGK